MYPTPKHDDSPPLREFNVSNQLLGDRAALDAAWERDGYWRRTVYQPGDLLVFSLETPHSGLANRSDRCFRLSMDMRGMRKSDNIPTVGKVKAVDACAITVATDEGLEKTFRIDEDTFCRITRGRLTGMPLELSEIPQLVKIGDPVYVASDHGTATFIRPQH